jgi:transcriptional regulator with XRE-family HTH domain
MTLATRLNDAMEKAGIPSQWELARRSNVSQPTVNRILKGIGRTAPTSATIAALATACNVSMEWLLEGKGSPDDTPPAPTPRQAIALGDLLIGHDVIELLTLFTQATDEGRQYILKSAQVVDKRPDALSSGVPIVNDKS